MNNEYTITKNAPVASRTLRVRLALMLCKVTLGVTFCCAVSHGVSLLWVRGVQEAAALKVRALDYLAPTVTPKEPTEEELGDLVARVSRERDIDPLILSVIADMESTGGKWLYRFEPEKFQEISRQGPHTRASDAERRMLASSHGPFHVLGLSAAHYCRLHWSKLYQPLPGARCAADIVQKHWKDTAGTRSTGERVREVFRKYNGSGDRAERYADDAMRKLAVRLYESLETKEGKVTNGKVG
jgi:hypothetical protein